MTHVNAQVRDAVAASLEANTSLEVVFTNRAADLIDADLPAAVIATATDDVARFSKGTSVSGPTELRIIQLAVVVVLYGDSETVDDDADALRVEIEPLVGPALSSVARVATHTGSELDIGTDEEGESWYAFLALTWEVEVVTAVGDPENPIVN